MPDSTPTVFYVEDDAAVRLGTMQSLQLAGFEVKAYPSAEHMLPHLVPGLRAVLVTDVRLPGLDGLGLLKRAQQVDPGLPVILVTGHGDITMAVGAMRQGAYDFVEKPYSPEALVDVVRRATEKRALSLEVESLRTALASHNAIEAKLVGSSHAMSDLRRVILDIASTNADVLIVGETGTGKELVARCLHDYGRGSEKVFAAINCAGLPEALFESEVFGHEAGAFTGAAKRRIGRMETANGGTLFLDEIEAMPTSQQAKMLRVLQERQFERLGSNESLRMNCRVVAATKSDLLHPPADAPFRSDLYYRLGVVVLQVAPLRERREDIPQLFRHFLLQASLRYERPVPEISGERLRELMAHSWPGNVRELKNSADRVILGLPMLAGAGAPLSTPTRSLDEQTSLFEKQLIEEALTSSGGRAAVASELLGIPKKTLYDKLKRLGISADEYRS